MSRSRIEDTTNKPSHELAETALQSVVLAWTMDDIRNEKLLAGKVRP